MDNENTNEQTYMQTDEVNVEWRDNKSLAECAQILLETKVMSDVTFSFKKHGDRKFKAHKLILSMRSAVFGAMFFGPLANNRTEIDVEDTEPDIFELVLRYIYTDKAELNGETVLRCLYAAKKYCLSGLEESCSCFLENSISPDNVCTIYEQAKFFDVEELKNKCYTFIVENSQSVFQNDDIKKLSYESLLLVFDDEKLQSEEILHFNVALRWAEEKCESENSESSVENKRRVLGEILGKIRFPAIPPDNFANEVIPTQILPAEEQIFLLQFMVTKKTKTPGRVGSYISLPRHDKRLIVNLENVGSLSTSRSYAYVFKIRSNFDIFLQSLPILEFQSLTVKVDDVSISSVGVADFEKFNGEMRLQNTSKIVLRAGEQYQLSFDVSRTHHRYITNRRVCHIATFGELSIVFDEIPQEVNKITFCRE
ncbi:BTB/POZ domain-containing protein 6-B-like [Mercenaria mercenaria]|uniref:BTB/POZ domain-containing protein 6-B-like n=1 Tax=Mercenaria mercenaria TaxID=6596 RepID=UPI00234E965F|nr:BTB/POZ domain-containing protein 6-B-like [Mercenaria mercenaria]